MNLNPLNNDYILYTCSGNNGLNVGANETVMAPGC